MALDSILKPFKLVDEQVLRQYTKLTKKWEDKGHSRYSLAMALNAPTLISAYGTNEVIYTAGIVTGSRGYDIAQNLIGLTSGEHNKGIDESGDKLIITNPYFFKMEKLMKLVRTPMFLFGSSFMVKGGANLYNYFVNNEQTCLCDAIEDFQLGFSSLGVASSIFIKNSDPKLLDKQPFWKTAYEKIRDKVRDLVPEPSPVPNPIPVQTCNTLENYVERI